MVGINQFTNYRSGLGNVGSYQASSIPFLSGSIAIASGSSPIVIEFPFVTKFVVVKNTIDTALSSAPLRFGFSEIGVQGNNYMELDNGESFSADFRVSKIFLYSNSIDTTGSIAAGLTTIDAGELAQNWSGSSGVG